MPMTIHRLVLGTVGWVAALLVPCAPAQAQSVARAAFTTGVVDREPVDTVALAPAIDHVFYFTEMRGLAGQAVTHQWVLDGQVAFELAFRVDGDRWRVWSNKRVAGARAITVRVVDEDGNVLREDALGGNAPVVAFDSGTVDIDVFRQFRYVSSGWPLGMSVGQTPAGGLSTAPSEPLVRQPPYQSREVFYGYLPLGNGDDGRITFVVDEVESRNLVAWIDRNNNEDLTDDGPPCRNEGTGRLACLVTVEVEVRNRTGTVHRAPYQLWFWLAEPGGRAAPGSSLNASRPLFYARCHYEGTVTLAGTAHRAIAFEMSAHDGIYREADICVDLDGDSKCADGERVTADGGLTAGNRTYRIRVR